MGIGQRLYCFFYTFCGSDGATILFYVHIAAETGIREFHFSARETIESKMLHRNGTVSMGGTVNIEEYCRPITTAERVKKTINALTDPHKD